MKVTELKAQFDALKSQVETTSAGISTSVNGLKQQVVLLEQKLSDAGNLDAETIAAFDGLKAQIQQLGSLTTTPPPVES